MLKLKNKLISIEFIILGNGTNTHVIFPSIRHKYKIGKVTYTAKRENLFAHKTFLKSKRFIAVFQEDGTAVTLAKKQIEVTYTNKQGEKRTVMEHDDKVTAKTLFIAERSRSLKSGLSGLFSTQINSKKILFFVAIGAVGVFVYMLMSGGIQL